MKSKLITSLIGAALVSAGSAYATPQLVLYDGTHTQIIVDNQTGDVLNTTLGAVEYSGPWNGFTITVDTGETKPIIGTATDPQLDLNFTVTSPGAGSLWIYFSETGFTANGTLFDSIGGTVAGGGTVTDIVGIGTDFQNLASVARIGPLSATLPNGGYSSSTTGAVNLTANDQLWIGVQVVFGNGGGVTSGNKNVSLELPDGGATVMLLGAALSALGLFRKKLIA